MDIGTGIVVRTKLDELLVRHLMNTNKERPRDGHRDYHLVCTAPDFRTRRTHRKCRSFHSPQRLTRRRFQRRLTRRRFQRLGDFVLSNCLK
jgi:hypothetical protein